MALVTRSVVEALSAELQRQVLSGAIPPGTSLAEVTIAEEFDVARPTAKAAIEQLVHIGLLRRLRNKTAKVPLLDSRDVADLYLSRGVIERAVAGMLAESGLRPPGADEALTVLREAIRTGQPVAALVESDIDFHRALVAATGSPRLRRLHEAVIGEAHLCMAQVQVNHLLHPKVIAAEHGRILDMVEQRDVDGAKEQMTIHLERARGKLIAHLQAHES